MKKLLVILCLFLVASTSFARDMRCKKWSNGHEIRSNPKKFKLTEAGAQTFNYQVENNLTEIEDEKLDVEIIVFNQPSLNTYTITSLSISQNGSTDLKSVSKVPEGTRIISTELQLNDKKVEIVCSVNLL
jgi:hypothetical protein